MEVSGQRALLSLAYIICIAFKAPTLNSIRKSVFCSTGNVR